MHVDSVTDNDVSSPGLLRRGVLVYYVGSVFFIAGIALSVLGVAFITIFRLHRGSPPEEILLTITFIGVGITVILTGMNLMIRQTRYGYYIVGGSAFMALLAVPIFAYNYPHDWYYPLISYLISLFVIGFLVLLGNAFANVTLWMIEGKSESVVSGEEKMKIYTDEEIERDIEEATRKSMEAAASELEFTVADLGELTLGKAFRETRGNITRIKDDVGETKNLRMTIHPSETDKWGSIGIDKVSMQLSETMEERPVEKDRFTEIVEGIRKKLKNLVNFVKLKR